MTSSTTDISTDCKLSGAAVVEAVSSVLAEMCQINDQTRQRVPGAAIVTRFHSICHPPISVLDYTMRIRQFATCSNSCFVIALMFLDRAQRNGCVAVDSLSVHRLLITAVMLATKVYDDRTQRNKSYAAIGGLPLDELNRLEIELLNALAFELEIVPDEFAKYEDALIRRQSVLITRSTATPAVSPIPPSSDTDCSMIQATSTTIAITAPTQSSSSTVAAESLAAFSPSSSDSQSAVIERSISCSSGACSTVNSPAFCEPGSASINGCGDMWPATHSSLSAVLNPATTAASIAVL